MAAGLKPTWRYLKQLHEGKLNPTPGNVEGILTPPGMTAEEVIKQRDSLTLRPSDVFIATYPKCGTTWMQQIVKLIVNNGMETGMDVDEFCPWVVHMTMEEIEAMPSPRFFKTHMPYNLMAGGDPVNSPAKYIYVIRNPKDVVVCTYHFSSENTSKKCYSSFGPVFLISSFLVILVLVLSTHTFWVGGVTRIHLTS